MRKPDYLFEVSWEVCNKVGGIHTVISTKADSVVKELAGELMAYCKRYNEPHFENPKIKTEIEKAVESSTT